MRMLLIAAMLAFLSHSAFAQSAFSVGKDGGLLKDGKPYHAIGINFFSALSRTLADPNDTTYKQGFAELAQRGIPFIRFMGGGFWPKDYALYRENRAEYFKRMDAFVKAAEEAGIGLIPSLFWYDACFSDLADEPRSAWADPNSKTVAFMRQYVQEVVTRYEKSPAIWAWELGNEYSLGADLPNAAEHRPWIHPTLGTRKERSAADDLTHDMIATISRAFGETVRQYDKRHLITTGHSLPRPAAHHLRTEKSWTPDTREQCAANLLEVTPDPINLISIHVYPETGRFGEKTTSYKEILSLAMQAAGRAGKALFVGEFGASDTEKEGGPEAARKLNRELIDAIETTGVPLSALWVYDLPDQDGFINVTPTNSRSYLLEELPHANRRMRERDAR